VLPFSFGPRSSEAHRASARARSVPCRVLHFEHMRFDLDTPDDLHSLMHQHSGDLPRELVSLWNL
jgi:2-phospho-L-lactate guanylyltransferase